ncbi:MULTISPECIES: catecholate siderophore receptor Fiu [unclassified Massilia]|uniref:catecholate siderophore receptor Fiu n=1 Tax=unclassified Massilia TaxID=2609279 RepID=UPI00177B3B6C|nr:MULTISPECIES: catecholate siderophore receptor Fiu [unclassified Massilia]MBD8530228.1 catecholate siderophore receptor Fiu [Massilia sp. CFBP 13647]MBD8673005.1 catecholate siderophore receptor Fiu [Massilia sp. CFBP 13721]
MQPIKSRKHAPSRFNQHVSAALATMLLPLAAGAADAPQVHDDAASAPVSKVEVVGKTENDFKAERAASPKYTEKLVDTAQSVQVIKKELIEQQGALTLTEALRNTPGVGAFFLGENGNTNTGDAIFMRGFDTSGSIFVDGVRDVGSVSRDVFNLEQIDVVKGPAGTDNGRGAPTGSVNLVSKKANMTDALSGSATVGSGKQKRLTADVNTVLNQERGIALRLNAVAQDSGHAARDVVNDKRWAIAPSLGFGLNGPTRVVLDYLHVDQDNIPDGGVPTIGLPGYTSPDRTRPEISAAPMVDPQNFYGSSADYDKIKADMATVRVEHDFAPGFKLHNIARYGRTSQDYLLTAFMGTSANIGTTPATINDPSAWTLVRNTRTIKDQSNKILTNQTALTSQFGTGALQHTLVTGLEFTSESQVSYSYIPASLGTVGVAGRTSLYNPDPNAAPVGVAPRRSGAYNDATVDTQSLYVFDTIKIGDKWIINGGVRADHYSGDYTAVAATIVNNATTALTPTHFKVGDTLVNGKLSVLYKPTANSSVYAMAASSKQPPGANFTVSGNLNSAQNPIYDPQETRSTEIGAKLDLFKQKLSLSAALFRTEVKNEVEQDPVDLQYYQTGKKRVQGVELGVVGELARNWLVSAGYLYMDTSVEAGRLITAGGENALTYTPKNSFTLWTSYDLPFGLKVGGGARYAGRLLRGTDGAVGTPAYADSYWVFDAMASYAVTPNLDLRLNVYNVGDERYVAAINKSGYRYTPGTPRAASLTANLRF